MPIKSYSILSIVIIYHLSGHLGRDEQYNSELLESYICGITIHPSKYTSTIYVNHPYISNLDTLVIRRFMVCMASAFATATVCLKSVQTCFI